MMLAKETNRSTGLAAILSSVLVILTVLALLVVSSLQIGLNFWTQQEVVAVEQRSIAREAGQEVANFVERIFIGLEAAAQVGNPKAGEVEEQRLLLERLLGLEPALSEVTLLDGKGVEVAKVARLRKVIGPAYLTSQAESELFRETKQGERYISSVYVDERTYEPLIRVGIPIQNVFGDVEGVLAAEVNLKFMWDLVSELRIGQAGVAYVVDKEGNLIAFQDLSRVLSGENVSHLAEVAEFVKRDGTLLESEEADIFVSTGINGTSVVSTYYPLNRPDWAVVVELPAWEAYQALGLNLGLSVGVMVGVALIAGLAGVYMAGRLAAPLHNLTTTATRIAEGEIELRAAVEGPRETVLLAGAFNRMTAQLQELIGSLEQRVVERTRRLEVGAALGERFNAILNLEVLLAEVVNQVKGNFGYYHAQIYLVDERGEKLVMAEGTGPAGAEMKAKGHSIAVEASTSLVARAAQRGETVRVDNVREAADWLANPLLPETRSEMAVPIILDQEVVGVLDVQQNRVAGLDEGDANLLRTLANQLAVAIRNARQFAEIETALAEARLIQQRYMAEAWEAAKWREQEAIYHYQRPGALPLNPTVVTQIEHEVLVQPELRVVEVKGKDQEQRLNNGTSNRLTDMTHSPESQDPTAIVAPIRLQDQTIGMIQLYETEQPRSWSKHEVALIEAVTAQVAQMAENLRLFDETQRRAGREQTIRQITERMRTASSLEELVRTTARELGERFGTEYTLVELGLEGAADWEGNG